MPTLWSIIYYLLIALDTLKDGEIKVTNYRRVGSPTGKLSYINGVAKVVDPKFPGEINVKFPVGSQSDKANCKFDIQRFFLIELTKSGLDIWWSRNYIFGICSKAFSRKSFDFFHFHTGKLQALFCNNFFWCSDEMQSENLLFAVIASATDSMLKTFPFT